MTTVPSVAKRISHVPRAPELQLPPWVMGWLGSSVSETGYVRSADISARVVEGQGGCLVTVRIHGAATMTALLLQRRTAEAYDTIRRQLHSRAASHPIRFWNFLPNIRSDVGDGMDRYMSFNAGRFAAYTDWFGTGNALDRLVATATGIGHGGSDLVIVALGSTREGIHVANPRQTQPHEYSRRFGPFPPCFARATFAPNSDDGLVLVGGTASVRGEASVHIGDVEAQTEETMVNLANLLRAVRERMSGGVDSASESELLASFDTLRVYYLHEHDVDTLRRAVGHHVPHLCDVEYRQADVCRAELLVEIEGTASLRA